MVETVLAVLAVIFGVSLIGSLTGWVMGFLGGFIGAKFGILKPADETDAKSHSRDGDNRERNRKSDTSGRDRLVRKAQSDSDNRSTANFSDKEPELVAPSRPDDIAERYIDNQDFDNFGVDHSSYVDSPSS